MMNLAVLEIPAGNSKPETITWVTGEGVDMNPALTDDSKTYTIIATASPTSQGTATQSKNEKPATVTVYKPFVTFQDTSVNAGDSANFDGPSEENRNLVKVEWKNAAGEQANANEMGAAPELIYDYDKEEGPLSVETEVKVTSVMPGDTLVEEFKISNGAIDCDYVKVYLQAIPHNNRDNPLSPSVAEHETVATMEDFLSQLRMQVYNGSERIYSASPNRTAQLTEPVYLGTLRTWKSMELEVILEVPIELGNEYANRVGEVDWVFTFEAYDDPNDNPKTGDYIMVAVGAMAVSAIALAAILIIKKKKKN